MSSRRFGSARRPLVSAARGTFVAVLSALFAALMFLLLPVLEQVNRIGREEMEIRSVGTADLPPPPPPPEEPPEQKEEEEPPPEIAEEAPPLDLSQLELALNPGSGDGFGDMVARLTQIDPASAQVDADAIFSSADLDQMPRPVFQPPPEYPAELRRKRIEGTVYVVFVVDKNGRVVNPSVQASSNPALDASALQAVRRWRFEPGRRRGQPVQFKMRVPITFAVS
ncbi:MAG: energy transducer TonB [Kiritimatiellae bacterium]|nr:energy transducer TonB [Kiritimatiellia bacterium]MDW8457698.1 energy transducer TonB [Verrucomicrobiota bacterium]